MISAENSWIPTPVALLWSSSFSAAFSSGGCLQAACVLQACTHGITIDTWGSSGSHFQNNKRQQMHPKQQNALETPAATGSMLPCTPHSTLNTTHGACLRVLPVPQTPVTLKETVYLQSSRKMTGGTRKNGHLANLRACHLLPAHALDGRGSAHHNATQSNAMPCLFLVGPQRVT